MTPLLTNHSVRFPGRFFGGVCNDPQTKKKKFLYSPMEALFCVSKNIISVTVSLKKQKI